MCVGCNQYSVCVCRLAVLPMALKVVPPLVSRLCLHQLQPVSRITDQTTPTRWKAVTSSVIEDEVFRQEVQMKVVARAGELSPNDY